MPSNDRLLKCLLAGALVPAVAVGLTACASGNSDNDDDDRGGSAAEAEGGEAFQLPFSWGSEGGQGGTEEDDGGNAVEPQPAPTVNPDDDDDDGSGGTDSGNSGGGNSGGSGGSGGSSSGEIVKFDVVEVTDVDWDTYCTDDYINGYKKAEDSNAYNNVSISINSDGSVDYIMVDIETGDSLYYSDGIMDDIDPPKMTYDGKSVQVTGQAALDYSYDDYVDFEIKLDCDDTY